MNYSQMPVRNGLFYRYLPICVLLVLLSLSPLVSYAQSVNDTVSIASDSIKTSSDSLQVPVKKSPIDAIIDYAAKDSIVFFGDGTVFLYGSSNIKYNTERPIELTADFIRMRMDSSTVHAVGRPDSLGELVGKPIFKEGQDQYESKEMNYNFKSKKGFIKGGVTQQGEGYIVADQTKKTEDDLLCMKGGKYTTCDNHDHPHFYLQMTKAKVKPGSFIAAGPAYMVMEDIPLPLAVPFGFFPFTSTYSSGVIMPSYGDEMERGFFLKNGGYYFAISDYFDLELTGEIYTKGTWGLNLASTYTKRYKFNGRFSANYREDVTGEKDMPNYNKMKNFKVSWTHRQDPKASQYSTLSASVDFATSGYNTSNVNNYYRPNDLSQNITSSSISYTQRFPESPWQISVNALVSQRTQDSTISISLPNIGVSMSRIYPFKRKNPVGKERFYEKIALSYSMSFANSINTKEYKLATSSFTKDWRNAVDHKIPISASFNLFKYLSITPAINYRERWYFNKVEKEWDVKNQQELLDTTSGFYRVYDFNVGVSMSTKLYGFYEPIRKIFGDKVDRIRHVVTPSLSFSYNPDFGNPLFGFYKSYDKLIVDKNNFNKFNKETVIYSPYQNGMYGVPGRGTNGALSFSLANNLEMKVRDTKDTTKVDAYKKISLIDNFTVSGGYNFAADTLRWQNFNASLRIKITKQFSLNLSGGFDPYMYDLNEYGKPVRVNKLRWNHGQFPRFLGTSTSFQYTFNNDTFKKKDKKDKNPTEEAVPDGMVGVDGLPINGEVTKPDEKKEKAEPGAVDAEGYVKPNVQWSLTLNYSVRWGTTSNFDYQRMDYKRDFSHNLSFNGYVNPTDKWKINFSGSYDFTVNKITQTTFSIVRDLHCWTLSASVSPFGLYKSYMVTIGVNASMLRDLKYEKRSDYSNSIDWF